MSLGDLRAEREIDKGEGRGVCSARLGVPRVATGAIVIDFDGTSNAHSVTHSDTHSGEHLLWIPCKGFDCGVCSTCKEVRKYT